MACTLTASNALPCGAQMGRDAGGAGRPARRAGPTATAARGGGRLAGLGRSPIAVGPRGRGVAAWAWYRKGA
ncbi:MAG TPA: hypothetical protein VN688_02010 [Gemmataceae bacterium]|nr:hypothetical protein [Gemmataceae bacterium]